MTELNETTFPKSGRVNEVCKEWVVREDSALAHRLQSQEINEHYQGNRYRNQVVRQDFPTALSEQMKEKEVAEHQAALYHQMIHAQEEADALVAQKLSENLRNEQELERRRHLEQSEFLACQLQDHLSIQSKYAPLLQQPESPEPIVNELPIPPKNLGMKFNGQRRLFSAEKEVSTSHQSYSPASPTDFMPNTTYAQDSAHLNYVSLELNAPKNSSQKRLANHHATQYTQVIAHNPEYPSPPGTLNSPGSSSSDGHHYEHINLHSHTPEKKMNPQAFVSRDYSFPPSPNEPLPPKPNKIMTSPTKYVSKQYELPKLPPKQLIGERSASVQAKGNVSPTNRGLQKLTTDSFDILMGNRNTIEVQDECDSLAAAGAHSTHSHNSERVFNSNAPNINRLDSVNDIQSYEVECEQAASVNSDRIRTLQELGVPVDEIFEIDRRMTQQEKDEEFARLLQEQESKILTQEEKDRLVAMEAQDKELARMLQEREKAKAKRAKERARIRKQQLQQEQKMQEESSANSALYVESPSSPTHSRTQSDPVDMDGDSYSDPIDLITHHEHAKQPYRPGEYFHIQQSSSGSRNSLLYNDENYSNPIDILKTSLNDTNHNGPPLPRPTKLDIRGPGNKPTSRAIVSDGMDNIAATIDPTFTTSSSTPSTANAIPLAASPQPPSNESTNFLPAHLIYTTPDQNSKPIPPYMPIQGTRRTNGVSQPDKKKKSKDSKCTHQ